MEPNKLAQGDGPDIPIEDLIKANMCQIFFAQATIKILEQAKSDRDELEIYREREKRRFERLYE